jgi:hypothetical protein
MRLPFRARVGIGLAPVHERVMGVPVVGLG